MAGSQSTQIDLRSSLDPEGVLTGPWKDLHSKIEQIFLKKMLAERKHVYDFEQFLKEIDINRVN